MIHSLGVIHDYGILPSLSGPSQPPSALSRVQPGHGTMTLVIRLGRDRITTTIETNNSRYIAVVDDVVPFCPLL